MPIFDKLSRLFSQLRVNNQASKLNNLVFPQLPTKLSPLQKNHLLQLHSFPKPLSPIQKKLLLQLDTSPKASTPSILSHFNFANLTPMPLQKAPLQSCLKKKKTVRFDLEQNETFVFEKNPEEFKKGPRPFKAIVANSVIPAIRAAKVFTAVAEDVKQKNAVNSKIDQDWIQKLNQVMQSGKSLREIEEELSSSLRY